MPATVSVLEGAQNVRIEGGTINAVSGDMTINDSSRRTKNYGSLYTTNNFGNAQNVNTGENHGTINQGFPGGSGIPPWVHDMYYPPIQSYQPGGGQGSRPPLPLAHSSPPAGPPYQQQPQYSRYDYQRGGGQPLMPPAHSSPPAGLPYQQQPEYSGYPPYQPPSATYPPRDFPPGHPQYQSSTHYAAPREERSLDEGLNPRRPVPLSDASHPGARSDLTASAPPTIASSNASAQGVTPSSWRSNNPYGASVPTPRDYPRS